MPWLLRYGQRLKFADQVRALVLSMLAYCTLSDEILNCALQSWPREQLADAVVGGRGARVAADGAVEERGDQLGLQCGVCADP